MSIEHTERKDAEAEWLLCHILWHFLELRLFYIKKNQPCVILLGSYQVLQE